MIEFLKQNFLPFVFGLYPFSLDVCCLSMSPHYLRLRWCLIEEFDEIKSFCFHFYRCLVGKIEKYRS
jgi:hypothetical protein